MRQSDLESFIANVQSNNFHFDDLFKSLLDIFEELVSLVNTGQVLNNINPKNIIYDPERRKMSLVDSGDVLTFDELPDADDVLNTVSKYYPVEYRGLYEKHHDSIFSTYKDYVKKVEKRFNEGLKQLDTNMQKAIKSFQNREITRNDLYYGIYHAKENDPPRYEFSEYFAPTSNVYSIGVIIIECYYTLMKRNELRIRNQRGYKEFEDKVLKHMVQFNPDNRITAKEAYDRMKMIYNRFYRQSDVSINR